MWWWYLTKFGCRGKTHFPTHTLFFAHTMFPPLCRGNTASKSPGNKLCLFFNGCVYLTSFMKHIFFCKLLSRFSQTLCDPIDGSPPGSPVPGILQARTLEWVALSFSNAWKGKVKGKSPSRVQLLATPWTTAHQALRPWDFPGKNTGAGCHCLPLFCKLDKSKSVRRISGFWSSMKEVWKL